MTGPLALAPRYAPVGWDALASQPDWLAGFVALLALSVCTALWAAWRERRAVAALVSVWLSVFRLIALAAIALAVVGFERRPATEVTEPSRVVVLVDASASMALPAAEPLDGSGSRSAVAVARLPELVDALAVTHEVRLARFGRAVVYDDDSTDTAFFEPVAGASRHGDALDRVLADHTAAPLAGVVLLSDGCLTAGADSVAEATAAGERRVPIHTIGFGAIIETPSVSLTSVTVPKRVFAGDDFTATAVVAGRGGYEGPVEARIETRPVGDATGVPVATALTTVRVNAADPAPMAVFTLEAPPPGEYVARIVLVGDDDRRSVEVRFDSVDRQTRVLLLAGGPSRDYRFLRDRLHLDESFVVDVLLQSAVGGVSQDANRLLTVFPDAEGIDAYDAIVAFDADWNALGRPAGETLEAWVARRGGGLLCVAGAARTLAMETTDPLSPLARLAPVTFGGDLLSVRLDTAAAVDPSPIRLSSAGASADFMRLDRSAADAATAWDSVGGFYARPPLARAKPAGTIYARIGQSDRSPPLLVEQFYGTGRVAYLATGQTWRLRRQDPGRFDRFYANLLRHLAQGRLLGAAARGRLTLDRERYVVGEAIRARLVVAGGFDEPPSLRWRLPDGGLTETRLDPVAGQPGAYTAERPTESPGGYEASIATADGLTLTASARVRLPSGETARPLRDAALLRAISEASGGSYHASADDAAASIAAATPSRAETRVELGPPDAAFGESLSRGLLLLAAVALAAEWTLRRSRRLA